MACKTRLTVKPWAKSLNDQSCWMDFSTPEITAVSNPNKNPPSAATIELPNAVEERFIASVVNGVNVSKIQSVIRAATRVREARLCTGKDFIGI